MNDSMIVVGEEQLSCSQIDLDWAQRLLARARHSRVRPYCTCSMSKPALYIRGASSLSLARMPGTGALHHQGCEFGKQYWEDYAAQEAQSRRETISLSDQLVDQDRNSLQLLWKASGLHVWKSSFKFRTWGLVRQRLLRALEVQGAREVGDLVEPSFIPAAFSETAPDATVLALHHKLSEHQGNSVLLIAPVKATYVDQQLPVLVLKHLPRMRVFVRNLRLPPAKHCVARLRIHLNCADLVGEEVEYLPVHESSWLPTASGQHAAEVDRLIASGSDFTIPLPFGPLGGICRAFAAAPRDITAAQSTIR